MPNATQSQADGSAQSKGQSTASPEASTNQVAAPTEGQAGRTFTKAEFDKMQSKKDREIADLRASLRAAETRATDLEDAAESLKEKVVLLQSEVDNGIPDDVKEYRSKTEKERESDRKAIREANREINRLTQLLDNHESAGRQSEAQKLADKYGVDVNALLEFDTTEKMKAYALDNMDTTKFATPAETQEKAASTVVESVKPEPKPAVVSATNAGGEVSDAQFWKAYGQPGFDPTPADHKRAKELREKMIRGG